MKDLTDSVLSNRITTKFGLLLRWSGQAPFLSSRGPFTLFVPTDSAFSRMSADTFAALQRPENRELLQRIILFHVVNGQRLSAHDMQPLKTLPSCEGSPLPLRINHSGYQIVGRAKIIHADIRCLNGLLDEIDTVLLPPGVSLAKLAEVPAPEPAAPTPAGDTNTPPADVSPPMPLGSNAVSATDTNQPVATPPDTNAALPPAAVPAAAP